MHAGFYAPPPASLSQGDIVSNIPWGLIEAPITLCRPLDRKASIGKANYWTVDPWQGHRNSPKPWEHDPEFIHAIGWHGTGVVLWHDCEIDKPKSQERARPEKAFAAIAPVLNLVTLQSGTPEETQQLQVAVRNGEHHAYFFLPAVTIDGIRRPDSYVNLRYIWSVRQESLLERKVSLSPDILHSLYSQLFVFFTRMRLDVNPTCPQCGMHVPLVRS